MDDNEHANEAISAVVDDGFLAEDDDDYEDLYNDVNVGENFLQSLNQTNNVANQEPESQPPPPPAPPEVAPAEEERQIVNVPRVPDPVTEVQKPEIRSDDVAPPPPNAMRINLGQQQAEQQPLVTNTNTNLSNQVAITGGNTVNTVNGGGYNRQGVNGGGSSGGGGGAMLFVGELHWWTTDADLESELCKYGPVKEVRFYDEKASGKSKGYAQVEFFDPAAAAACKENMNGHMFNGRPCVVAFASPFSIKRMGEAQVNRATQSAAGAQAGNLGAARRDGPLGNTNNNNNSNNNNNINRPMGNNVAPGGGYQGGGDFNNNNNNNRGGYGRGNWGRGNGQGMGGRGPIRNRPMMGRGMMGNGFGAGPPMLPPQAMMGQSFDPTFGGPMGRMGGYGGFPGGPNPPFSGMMSSFPPVGGVGLPGVAPHVNPAFFGRGMGMNGMGMMGSAEGGNMGMWSDPNMGGWGGEEHGGRVAESSYAEEAVSDHQYGEVSRERAPSRPAVMKEKDRGGEREWSGSSEKRYRDDREPEYERDMPREKEVSHDPEWQERRHRDERDVSRERDRERERGDREQPRERSRDRGRERHRDERERYVDHHRYKERDPEYDDDWDRGRSSRTHSKSRLSQDEGQHFRSRDGEYSKRRRLTSE